MFPDFVGRYDVLSEVRRPAGARRARVFHTKCAEYLEISSVTLRWCFADSGVQTVSVMRYQRWSKYLLPCEAVC